MFLKKREKVTESTLVKALNYAYDKAVNGVANIDSAQDLATNYLKNEGNLRDQINALIRWQVGKCAISGFVTNIGGMITIPVTLPLNITSVLFIQVRMIAAIAIMCGYDVKDDRTKCIIYYCLVANSVADITKGLGLNFGEKIAIGLIKKIPVEIVRKLNKEIGFRLLTKFGQKGIINIGRFIPLLGGVICATIDATSTNTFGNIARDTFLGKGYKVEDANYCN